MAKRHILQLTAEQEQELRDLRDNGDRAYLRERAAAMLKIASGIAPHKVALSGLLKKRKPDTLYTWLRRYREHGISGLRHKPGRGRKPAFAPHTDEEAEAELQQLVRHPPQLIDKHETRWTLRTIGKAISWLRDKSVAGVHQILTRFGISYKRGRIYIHSPDTEYAQKLESVQTALQLVKQTPDTHVAFYQDEFAFYRQPTVAKDWTQTGEKTPLARHHLGSEATCYGLGALNAHTGDLVYQQTEKVTVVATHTFYAQICHRYPYAERIYLIQDNRPVHLHLNLLDALLPQTTSFAKPVPPSWVEKRSEKIGVLSQLPIEILQLPTYAPWTNPIEKLWRWVRQSVLHLHRLSDDWESLQQRVLAFMAQFEGGSQELLRYVGLLPD